MVLTVTLSNSTIVPRGPFLGYVSFEESPNELHTKRAILSKIDMALGGRAAEEILLDGDSVTEGAANDLQVATRLATILVTVSSRHGTTKQR